MPYREQFGLADLPKEIDGYETEVDAKGRVWTSRPLIEQIELNNRFVPAMMHIIEKYDFCPTVCGFTIDESFVKSKTLPIYHVYDMIDSDMGFNPFQIGFVTVEDGVTDNLMANAIPINPFTREIIFTVEQAEALNLDDYEFNRSRIPLIDDASRFYEIAQDITETYGYGVGRYRDDGYNLEIRTYNEFEWW